MKRGILFALLVILVIPGISKGDDFLGLPLVPDAKVIERTEALLVIESTMSHDQAVEYYNNILKDEQDIKIREWESESYIEDDGARPWHSITIPKQETEKIRITIKKDNWSWIISTLVLRYIAVFIILIIIYISILLSGKVISGAINRAEQKKAAKAG